MATKTPTAKRAKSSKQTQSFEQAFTTLEALVEQMEQGELSLDELLKQYTQAQELITNCQEMLEKAELRMEELSMPTKEKSPKLSQPPPANEAKNSQQDEEISLF